MIRRILGEFYLSTFKSNNRLERIWKIAQVDFKKRYYNDKMGLLWALINPLTQICIYYFVFTEIFQRNKPNYALYLFCGIIIWLAFAEATNKGLKVLSNKLHLIENIQFNWLDLYLSHMISILMGLSFNLIAYLVILYVSGASLGAYFFYFPIVLLTWFLLSAGTSIILGLIKPLFVDIVHLWSLFLMIGFWVSGIFFSGSFYFEDYAWFPHLNPFVGVILNARSCLLENNEFYFGLMIENLIFSIVLYSIAAFLFNKYSKLVIEKL